MRAQSVLLLICISGVWTVAVEQEEKSGDRKIVRILTEISAQLETLDIKATDVIKHQKGFEHKLKDQRDQIEGIVRLEAGLLKLEQDTVNSFQLTATGVRNLTAIINSSHSQNEKAIRNLGKVEIDIKRALGQVDAVQNKHEQELNKVAKSVDRHLEEIEQLLKQSVIREIVSLDRKAKGLQHQQRNIEAKVVYLDELNALTSRANQKVDQLQQGLRSLNYTQAESLDGIEKVILAVQGGSSQIDHKLGALLRNQKNIESTLDVCKRGHYAHTGNKKPQDRWSSAHQSQPRQKPTEYETSYATEEEAEYLYKLWYGKENE
ncbi:uncharacterized protein [Drosophila pseudoobscura]|uniref:Uncharacterized protein isoform X1 n=2 Tax=Drosophila pseudoobscura pseudoobscura TaxID=46245 RepID=A0A6I8UJ33_DROPS|nr:uncharacterized protein LOC4816451 isoform X1 [Drosophila pseudoobscura]